MCFSKIYFLLYFSATCIEYLHNAWFLDDKTSILVYKLSYITQCSGSHGGKSNAIVFDILLSKINAAR